MECSCSIDSCDGEEGYEDYEQKFLVHNLKSLIIKCGECNREIKLGEKFEWFRGEYDGDKHTHHTCIDCLSLRKNFFGDWTFEQLWEDFCYHMDDCSWEIPESCLSKVTPKTRNKICEMIEKERLIQIGER